MRCLCRLALSLLVVVAGLTDATPHGQESALWEVTIPQLYYCVSDYVDFIGCPSPTTQWSEMLSISPRNGSTLWEVTSQQPGVATGGVNFQFCPQRPNDAYLVSGAGLPSQSVLLSALNKSTGTVYWTAPVANGTTPMMRCSNDGQLIYLVAYATVSTFEASTGTARWSLNVQGAQVYNFLEVADVHANATSLIFIDAQGVHRVDARTGKHLPFALRLQSNDMLLGTVGPLVIIQKANTSVVATTVEGHAVWWWLVGFVPQQSFAQLFGDVLLFGETNDNVVEAINATTGKRLWTRPIGMDVPTLAAVTRDLVVLSVVGPMLQNNTLYSYASWEAVSLATGELRWALYNITTGCADNFITANYFGVTNDAGDAIVAFKVADGTNRTLPLDAACGNGLIVTETRQLLLVQNNSAAIAYSKTW